MSLEKQPNLEQGHNPETLEPIKERAHKAGMALSLVAAMMPTEVESQTSADVNWEIYQNCAEAAYSQFLQQEVNQTLGAVWDNAAEQRDLANEALALTSQGKISDEIWDEQADKAEAARIAREGELHHLLFARRDCEKVVATLEAELQTMETNPDETVSQASRDDIRVRLQYGKNALAVFEELIAEYGENSRWGENHY